MFPGQSPVRVIHINSMSAVVHDSSHVVGKVACFRCIRNPNYDVCVTCKANQARHFLDGKRALIFFGERMVIEIIRLENTLHYFFFIRKYC